MPGKILPIALMGENVLNSPALEVQDIASPEIQQLIQDMRATMRSEQAAGIAAPQVFAPWRIFIFQVPATSSNPKYQLTPQHDPEGVPETVIINPTFTPLSDQMYEDWEGCLSVPGLLGRVERYYSIKYTGFSPDGEIIEREAHGFHARVFQHEFDHIDGQIFPFKIKQLQGNFGYKEVFFPTIN